MILHELPNHDGPGRVGAPSVSRAIGPWAARLGQRLAAQANLVARLDRIADRIGLTLLLLASGALLLRPADLFPFLEGAPIYGVLIVACMIVSLPRLMPLLARAPLYRNGVLLLMVLLVPAVVLSHVSHLDTWDARLGGAEMAKACLFSVLIVALVDSPRKLMATLAVIVAAVWVVAVLAVLQYHGWIDLPALRGVEGHSLDPDNPGLVLRLCGVGVFNDPNDFALVLVTAAALCVFGLNERRLGPARWNLLIPLAWFGYALLLTRSRGGLVSAAGALLAFLPARFGWRNALPLACVLAPAVLAPFWGRQTSLNLSDPDDTFQSRLSLWSDSLDAFRSAPLFGIGQGKLVDVIGQVSHNSFLHAFAELGLFGGFAFIGAFDLALRGVQRAVPEDQELARLRPYMLAIAAGYAAGFSPFRGVTRFRHS